MNEKTFNISKKHVVLLKKSSYEFKSSAFFQHLKMFWNSEITTFRKWLGRSAVHHSDWNEVWGHRSPAVHQEGVAQAEGEAGVPLESNQVGPFFVLKWKLEIEQWKLDCFRMLTNQSQK
jgi:hypothetical protein